MTARARRFLAVTTAVVLAALGLLAMGEAVGWPWLAGPVEQAVSQRIGRTLRLSDEGRGFTIRLLGGLRVQASEVTLANPPWAATPWMLRARDAEIRLRYRDLLGLNPGRPLRVAALRASELELDAARLADGRANWQFDTDEHTPAAPARFDGVTIDEFQVDTGRVRVDDQLLALRAEGRFDTRRSDDADGLPWNLEAQGHYGAAPLQLGVRLAPALGWLSGGAAGQPVPLRVDLMAGDSLFSFIGTARDLLGRDGLAGRYAITGPSLAAAGRPLGLTLPATARFAFAGTLWRGHDLWHSRVDVAAIGRSLLDGDFTLRDRGEQRPLLAGRLHAERLLLQDLGPAVGVQPGAADAGLLLPRREFDLPSLTAMDADVQAVADVLDLGSPAVKPIRPLRTHIALQDGVLTLDGLDARLADGRLSGRLRLDGREPRQALWNADLRLGGLRIERFVQQGRGADQPPYLSGALSGGVTLSGRGRSTAQLLASSDGRLWALLGDARLSHLAIEAAGLDLAQALGVWVRGDDALPVQCGAIDLAVRDGRLTPRVAMVDTRDSTVWAEGQVSLDRETLDLRVQTAPKDISPLSLRAPLRVRGPIARPVVDVEGGALARRLVPAALLAAVSPLAALLPLVDLGEPAPAAALQACRALVTPRDGGAGA